VEVDPSVFLMALGFFEPVLLCLGKVRLCQRALAQQNRYRAKQQSKAIHEFSSDEIEGLWFMG
jgi:hypothetical protein